MGKLFVLIFGKRVGRIIAGVVGILASIYSFMLLNGPNAASYGVNTSDPTLRIVSIAVPIFFIVLGIVSIVFGFIGLFPRGRRVSPIAAVARLLFGVLFIGIAVYLFQSNLISVFFKTVPPSESTAVLLYTDGIPAIFLLGGGLMILYGLLGLIFGRPKGAQLPYSQPTPSQTPQPPYNQWGQPFPSPQPYDRRYPPNQ